MSSPASLAAKPSPPQAATVNRPCQRLLVRDRDKYVIVRMSELVWLEAAANYVVLHTLQGNHVIRRTLRELEDMLDPRYFFRTSRSTIANLRYAREIELAGGRRPLTLCLTDGARVPLRCGLRLLEEKLQRVD